MRRDGTYGGIYNPAARAVPFILFGLFWTFVTGAVFVNCLSFIGRFGSGGESCIASGIFLAIGVAMTILGIAVAVGRPRPRPAALYHSVVPPPIVGDGPLPSAPAPPRVQVRCRYCGRLSDEGVTRCPACGAPLYERRRLRSLELRAPGARTAAPRQARRGPDTRS
ncbi:MAG: hypothetical protein L3K06_01620 [Thermoplasmata archaeon]|nr:hypothetical protein [Thermoplasmata archaeon]MCI4354046.1 hypothetical protein [Thermoplasmata archaeon]